MEQVDDILYILKLFFMGLFESYIFSRLVNSKIDSKKIKVILLCSLIGIAFIGFCLEKHNLESTYLNLFMYLSMCFVLSVTFKMNNGYTMLATILSISICVITYLISVIITFGIENIIHIENKIITFFIILFVHIILILGLLKIRRLKNGLSFLQNNTKNYYLNIAMFSISSIIIFLYSLITYKVEVIKGVGIAYSGENITRYLVINFFIFGIIMIFMIQETLNLTYKHRILENTLKDYEKTIKEKDEKINRLSDEKFKINKLNHEFYNRQKSLELKVEKALQNMKFELSEEFDLGDKILELSKEYTNKVIEIKSKNELPKTDIEEIDDMFSYMQSECIKNGIEFILQVNGNIHYLINNIINKNKLVTLIGDHLRDAIIAINYSDNKYKSIFAILGIKDDVYEFCIYDSGIEFEIETFRKLGLEPATTHKDNGGTGIGFITTFETLKETKASLIIEEKNELMENSYTKAVKFRFDDKNEFKIISYRANDIKENINSNRILMQKFNPQ